MTQHARDARQARRPLVRTATAAAALTLCASVQAQQAQSEQITITGIRGAIESAINIKKNSDNIVEAISAEDIGKLPDTSIAESIARLPGVAAQRFQGRAQSISFRGFSPDFSTVLLNGREQVSTGDSRAIEFDQYPSELINAVTVFKTPDAALIGQGLSATVNLQLVRPLDYGRRVVAANYRKERSGIGLENSDEGDGYRASLSYVDQFADRTIGLALGFARLDESTALTQRFEAWGVADTPFGGGTATVKTPGGFNSWTDQTERRRDAFMGVLEWRPMKEFSASFDFFHSKFKQDLSKKAFQAPIGFTSGGGYDPTGTLTTASVSGGVANSGTFDNFKGVIRNDTEFVDDKTSNYGLNLRYALAGWNTGLDLNHAKTERTGEILETTAGLPGNGTQVDTISWTGFDGTSVGNARYSTGLNYADRNVVKLTDVQGWGGGVATPQAGYSKLPNIEDKIDAARINAKKALPDGYFISDIDFGAHYSKREKTRAYIEGRLVLSATDPFAAVTIPGSATQVAGQSGIPIAVFNPAGTVGSVYQIAPKLVPDIANKDWSVDEKLATVFVKGDIDSQLFGRPLRGNVGLQVVHTDQSSTAFNIDTNSCPGDVCATRPNSAGATYYDVLPSLNLASDLGGGHTLRLGLARQMARPTLNDMRASFNFGVDSATGVQILKGSAGNPELKPYRANAVDLSYEKYWSNRAYVALTGFYKDLKTYIIKSEQATDFAPYVTSTTPLPTSGPFAGSTLGLLTQPLNGSGGNIRGLELSGSLEFGLLTPWLEGFGLQAGYAYTRSSVSLPTSGFLADNVNTTSVPLPGLSKRVSNLTFYYERFGFSARFAQRYRSDFVGEITDIVGDRRLTYVKGERITDAQIGYEFGSGYLKGLSVLFQANNITDERYVRYRDTPSNEIENTKYGRTYLFGLNYKL